VHGKHPTGGKRKPRKKEEPHEIDIMALETPAKTEPVAIPGASTATEPAATTTADGLVYEHEVDEVDPNATDGSSYFSTGLSVRVPKSRFDLRHHSYTSHRSTQMSIPHSAMSTSCKILLSKKLHGHGQRLTRKDINTIRSIQHIRVCGGERPHISQVQTRQIFYAK
jgi:hypothetical protein